MRIYWHWKRHAASNITGIICILIIIAVYISLLKYNKSNVSTFNLVPRYVRSADSDLYEQKISEGGSSHIRGNKHGRIGKSHIFLVEEHHEVLPVWFDSVKNGYIPGSGNTLIHIDGHSDMAPPFFLSRYPAWKMPKDKKDINLMMQRNDAFIVEAAMAGLIKKVVWIWPAWDEKRHEAAENTVQIQVGWAMVESQRSDRYKVFCLCYPNKTTHTTNCIYLSLEDSREGKAIKSSLCHVKKSFTYREIREDLALKKIQENKLLHKDETVLLDIDEDYYGNANIFKALLDVNMTMKSISQIDNVLKKLVCPKDTNQEKFADQMLASVISALKKAGCSKPSPSKTTHSTSATKFPPLGNNKAVSSKKIQSSSAGCEKKIPDVDTYLKKYIFQTKHSLGCLKRNSNSERLIRDLIKYLSQLTKRQQKSLQSVGFCMTTSHKSSRVISEFAFHICHGLKLPGNGILTVHIPSAEEISQRSKLLQNMLTHMKTKKPALITLCRSVRDGFTPRKYFSKIESEIMKTLNFTYKKLRVHYDSDLLGGKHGWPGRHKVPK